MQDSAVLDSNVLVYAVDEGSRYHFQARSYILNTGYKLFTTSKNISEFLVVLTRGISKPVSSDKALELLRGLLGFVFVLYPDSVTLDLFFELLSKYKTTGLKIHDLEIVSITLGHDIKRIVTVDAKDYRRFKEVELILLEK